MKSCRHCGCIEPDNAYMCTVCDRPLPFKGPSELFVRKVGLTLTIPFLVWVVMTRLLGV